MTTPPISDGVITVRSFVPAKDLQASLRFYGGLGFQAVHYSDSLALLTMGELGFLLQLFDLEGFAQNYMMQLVVADLDAWWSRIENLDLVVNFGVQAPAPPVMQPWGLRVAYVFDPSGVLWHVAEHSA